MSQFATLKGMRYECSEGFKIIRKLEVTICGIQICTYPCKCPFGFCVEVVL